MYQMVCLLFFYQDDFSALLKWHPGHVPPFALRSSYATAPQKKTSASPNWREGGGEWGWHSSTVLEGAKSLTHCPPFFFWLWGQGWFFPPPSWGFFVTLGGQGWFFSSFDRGASPMMRIFVLETSSTPTPQSYARPLGVTASVTKC